VLEPKRIVVFGENYSPRSQAQLMDSESSILDATDVVMMRPASAGKWLKGRASWKDWSYGKRWAHPLGLSRPQNVSRGGAMTYLMIDDDGGCMTGTRVPPPPDFRPPTIAESLARGFEGEADFYDLGGKPVAVWPDWDYAVDWSCHPIREIHPFVPVLYGAEITETAFRERVRELHGLTNDP